MSRKIIGRPGFVQPDVCWDRSQMNLRAAQVNTSTCTFLALHTADQHKPKSECRKKMCLLLKSIIKSPWRALLCCAVLSVVACTAGTPLQNSIKELWALLHFLDAYKFPSCEQFEARHSLDSADEVTCFLFLPASSRQNQNSLEPTLQLPWHTSRLAKVGHATLRRIGI